MPAKRPAPKSTKGKKAASRPPARKALARKPDVARARVVAVNARKSTVAAPRKAPAAHTAEAALEPAAELRKAPRPGTTGSATPPAPTPQSTSARTPVPPANAEGDDGEGVEPGSLLAG